MFTIILQIVFVIILHVGKVFLQSGNILSEGSLLDMIWPGHRKISRH